MKKILKILGITIGSLVGLVVLLIIILKLIPDDRYNGWISSAVTSATGRDFQMQSLELDFGTTLRIGADGVRMANASWSDKGDMLSVGHLEAELKLLSLLKRKAEFSTVLESADILAQINQKGVANWTFSSDEPEQAPEAEEEKEAGAGLPIKPLIRELRLDNIMLTLVDERNSHTRTARLNQLLIETPEQETSLILDAIIEDTPVQLAGSLGNIDQALDIAPDKLDITGQIEENTLAITGEWGPVHPQPNLDLVLDLKVPSTSDLAALAGQEIGDFGILELSARTRIVDGVISVEDILTTLDGEQTTTSISGHVPNVMLLGGMDIAVQMDTDALEHLIRLLSIELPVPLPPEVHLSAVIQGDKQGLNINDIDVEVLDEGISFTLKGAVTDILKTRQIQADFKATLDSLDRLSKYADMPIPPLGAATLLGKLASSNDVLGLPDLDLKLQAENFNFSVSGAVAEVLSTVDFKPKIGGIKAQVGADIDYLTEQNITGLTELLNKLEVELPLELLPESLSLHTGVGGDLDQLALQDINIEVADKGLKLAVSGNVENVLTPSGVAAHVSVNAESVAAFSKYAGLELPGLGAVAVTGNIQSEEETLALQNLDTSISAENLTLLLSGTMDDLLKVKGVDVKFDGDITSLSEQNIAELSHLLKSFDVELPVELLPQSIKLSTGIGGDLEKLGLSDIDAQIIDGDIQLGLTGAVEDVFTQQGIDADLSVNADSISSFEKYAAGAQLPDSDPLSVKVHLGAATLEQADITVKASTGGAKMSANSTLSLKEITNDLSLEISVQADNLTDFNKLAQQELPDNGPLDLSASVQVKPRNFSLDNLKLSIADDQSVTGHLMLQQPDPEDPQGVTMLRGKIDIPYLDLNPLLPKPAPEEETTEENPADLALEDESVEEVVKEIEEEALSDEPPDESERLLSSEPIISSKLNHYEVDLTLNATKLNIGNADIRDVALAVYLHKGLLSISPIEASGSSKESGLEGGLNGYFLLETNTPVPAMQTQITLTQFPMAMVNGGLDLHLNVDGQGRSVAELMASMNGQILLSITDGEIDKSFASSFGSGLFSFSGESDTTAIECAILRVDIEDGVADFQKKLAAQLTEVTWHGGGTVDFNTERLSADIAPKPRKGVPISVGGSLAGLVKLTGTLKNPSVAPDYSDVAMKYGKYSAYVATGGMSLLAEIVAKKMGSNQDVCGQILDGTVFGEDDPKKSNPPR